MTEQAKPALTPEEWERARAQGVETHPLSDAMIREIFDPQDEEGSLLFLPREALAALALYGRPSGFTWDDADALRATADALEHDGVATRHAVPALRSIADRIERMLPPRDP